MPKFCANLSFLFTEVPFPQRFQLAAQAGFRGVEFMSPYEYRPEDVAAWARSAGVETVLFNLPAGDWAGGERGLACLPHREADFRESVERALVYADALGCRRVHCMAGLRPARESETETRRRFVSRLRHAADRFSAAGITVLIEPINSRIDMPGYWLDTPAKAFELREEIARDNVRVQLDVYHATVMGDDAAELLRAHLRNIAHLQIADHPGRHEPGTGEIDFPSLFTLLDALPYEGWVACEYRPQANTGASFGWLDRVGK